MDDEMAELRVHQILLNGLSTLTETSVDSWADGVEHVCSELLAVRPDRMDWTFATTMRASLVVHQLLLDLVVRPHAIPTSEAITAASVLLREQRGDLPELRPTPSRTRR